MLVESMSQCPLVAILRGIAPTEAVAVSGVLIEAGFRIIEVPLTSPDALVSIGRIGQEYGDRALIGAGTVTELTQVEAVHRAGGRLIFSPNCNLEVIRRTKALGMVSMPGCMTPSEMFDAIGAGADVIKCFPAEMISPAAFKAMRTVVPASVPMIAVGGVGPDNMADYLRQGAAGFGIGSSLYKPGREPAEIGRRAGDIVSAYRAAVREME